MRAAPSERLRLALCESCCGVGCGVGCFVGCFVACFVDCSAGCGAGCGAGGIESWSDSSRGSSRARARSDGYRQLAAELAEQLGPGTVTLAVGPTRSERGWYPGDPGAGLLPGFRDTCDLAINLGRGGAGRYTKKWLRRKGVRLLERWAVPPPPGATLADGSPARCWRDAGDAARNAGVSWEVAGPAANLEADAIFDCRGVRPNTRESYTRPSDGVSHFGLPAECIAPSGWLWVDDKFRLAAPATAKAPPAATADALPPAAATDAGNGADGTDGADSADSADGADGATRVEDVIERLELSAAYGGRVYCVGDAAEKDKQVS